MSPVPTIPDLRDLRDERGFTLVEMLVTILVGVVVLLATFAVLDLSVRQSARATDRVEADQRGRTALEQLMQELHSACVAASVTPVQPGSDGSNLSFYSQFGSAAVLAPNLHQVAFSGGTLTDTVYAYTGDLMVGPPWPPSSFSSTPTSTKTLISNAAPGSLAGVAQPLFQYYKYVNGQLSSTALATPLSSADAALTAAVTISLAAKPGSNSTEADRTANLSDTAVLRTAPSSADVTATNLPCQ